MIQPKNKAEKGFRIKRAEQDNDEDELSDPDQ
jgi:hypothetical protein